MGELIAAGLAGWGILLSWPNILYPLVGTVGAMIVSFLPGVSGVTLMAILLPLTFSWETEPVLLLFGALVGGATFMGSITAILFNVPGAAPNAATMLDGHPMAQRGEAKTAIGCAATASALGSCIGILVLVALLPAARSLVLAFGPLEFLLLALWGLTTVVMVGGGTPLRGLATAGLGLAFALVGKDPRTAEDRWTFGSDYLADGLAIVPVLLGLFAIAQVIGLMASREPTIAALRDGEALRGSLREGFLAVLRHRWLLVRSSLIGTVIGLVPGVGGTVASFVAYGHAVQSAADRSRFGKGDIRGVLAPEASHDAKDGGSLLPVLAFGMPGSEGTVLLLAALAIHGVIPGRQLLEQHLPLVFALIWALFLSNLLTSLLGVAIAGRLARVTTVRLDRLLPVILALVVIAAVAYRGRSDDLVLAAAFGIVGFLMLRFGWPRVPFVIAFVLGRLLEDNLLLTLRLMDLGRVTLLGRPIALVILALILLTLAWALRQRARRLPESAT